MPDRVKEIFSRTRGSVFDKESLGIAHSRIKELLATLLESLQTGLPGLSASKSQKQRIPGSVHPDKLYLL